MSTLTPELRADDQQAMIFCHRCGHDTTWTRVAERGTNVCNECGVTWFAMDHNIPGQKDLFGKEQVPGECVCHYCVEDRERA
jgi:ribosomal protein L37E